jgi:hypothetical protein
VLPAGLVCVVQAKDSPAAFVPLAAWYTIALLEQEDELTDALQWSRGTGLEIGSMGGDNLMDLPNQLAVHLGAVG